MFWKYGSETIHFDFLGFRQIACYLAEQFRRIACYLAERFRQIASSNLECLKQWKQPGNIEHDEQAE